MTVIPAGTEHAGSGADPISPHRFRWPGPHRVLSVALCAALAGGGLLAAGGVASAQPPPPAPAPACSGGWSIPGVQIEGAPRGFDAGDAGRTYLWHDGNTGWHMRTTDARPGPHHYWGAITTSNAASLADVKKVKVDSGDQLSVSPDKRTLYYSFTTYTGIDGIDFHVSGCNPAYPSQTLTFEMHKNDNDRTDLIDIGPNHAHPAKNPFSATRGAPWTR
ncbi:MAG TPA: hypothetical protein VGM60_04850 [Pseudonocardia sp.]|uniref:hypothetical protein n=1 Tax=Pseudonocardia sp. TaxID=60912 RepID=UPI002F416518